MNDLHKKYAKLWKELARKMRECALTLESLQRIALTYCHAQHDDIQRLLSALDDIASTSSDPQTVEKARAAIRLSFPDET
jgi:hypothetical protein